MTGKMILFGVVAFFLLIFVIAFFPIVVVGAGERGVVFNSVSGVEPTILGEGTHTRIPFVESVIDMPIKTQVASFEENAGSADSQTIDIKLTVNWRLDPARVNYVYQNIGDTDAVVSKVLTNNVQDAVKAQVSKYAALDFQRNRENVRANALTLLQQKVKQYDIIVDNLSITNIQFSPDFNAAVEQAQIAQQKAKQAEYQVQSAKANADAAVASAEGQAHAQQLLQQDLTPQLLQKMAIDRWDGKLPTYMNGNAPLPFLNVTGQ